MIPLRNVVAFVALSGILIKASAQEPTIADCAGSVRVCIDTTFSESPGDSGTVADLGAGNHGCMESNERQGVWVRFTTNATGTVAFTINPTAGADYDLALWGPYAADPVCPTQAQPIRCSFSAINGGTGLNYTAVDLSEGAGGNSWVRYLDVGTGDTYLLYVNNFTMNGVNFDLVWDNEPDNLIDCLIMGASGTLQSPVAFSMRPNPATDRITVSTPFTGTVAWMIADNSGRVVLRDRATWTERGTIDVGMLAQGTYVLRLVDAWGRSNAACFVKQ